MHIRGDLKKKKLQRLRNGTTTISFCIRNQRYKLFILSKIEAIAFQIQPRFFILILTKFKVYKEYFYIFFLCTKCKYIRRNGRLSYLNNSEVNAANIFLIFKIQFARHTVSLIKMQFYSSTLRNTIIFHTKISNFVKISLFLKLLTKFWIWIKLRHLVFLSK